MTVNRTLKMPAYRYKKNPQHTVGDVDGVPFYENEYEFLVNQRSAEDYRTIKAWVDTELMPFMTRKSINERHSSYGLKHVAESELGFYVSNGDIKLALLENGVPFKAEFGSPNPMYPLSERFYKSENRGRRR
jgi:hypothetical protein